MGWTMANNSQWVLFGYDLRGLWQSFAGAWREVFLDYGSGIRLALDEPVTVHPLDGAEPFAVGIAAKTVRARAILVPEAQVLTRQLTLPRLSENNLESIVRAEVTASSPFPAEDTAWGWRLVQRSGDTITVALAVISKSALANYLHDRDPELSLDTYEIWAEVASTYVVIEGFGESERNRRYRRRLQQFTGLIALTLLCLLALAAVPGVYKAQELEKLESAYEEINSLARQAVAARADLARQNELLVQLNTLTQATTNPVFALDTITRLLGDDVWINRYVQQGNVVELDGNATNAAELMQQLSDSALFESVEARSGFRRLGNSGLERFQLELTFAMEPVPGD